MFINSDVHLANKQSAFLLIILPCVLLRRFQAENTVRSQVKKLSEYFVKKVLGLTN